MKCHFLIWMMMRQPTKRQCSWVLTLKYTFICVYWWTRQRIHNTLIVVDRYICDSWGIKRFQTRRSLVWNCFIPHSSQVSIYHIKVWWIINSTANALELLQSCTKPSIYGCSILKWVSSETILQGIRGPSQCKDVVLPVKGSPCQR